MRHARSWFAVGLSLLSLSCFELEETVDLKKDMSGVAGLKIGIDFEPMVVIMAQMKHEMGGGKGPVSKNNLDAARAEFLKESKEKKGEGEMKESDVRKELPAGIELLDFAVKQDGLRMISTFRFSFDKLPTLVALKLPSSEGGDPTKKSVIESPFDGLKVVEQGTLITITTKPQNPSENVEKQTSDSGAKVDPEMEKMMKDAMKNLRVAYRITAPFKVVESNATRREGETLIWEYDLATFEAMEKSRTKIDPQLKVVFRR